MHTRSVLEKGVHAVGCVDQVFCGDLVWVPGNVEHVRHPPSKLRLQRGPGHPSYCGKHDLTLHQAREIGLAMHNRRSMLTRQSHLRYPYVSGVQVDRNIEQGFRPQCMRRLLPASTEIPFAKSARCGPRLPTGGGLGICAVLFWVSFPCSATFPYAQQAPNACLYALCCSACWRWRASLRSWSLSSQSTALL